MPVPGRAYSFPARPSRNRGPVDSDRAPSDPDRTQGPLGTPEYMAPEQYQGQPAEPAADIWGLGVSLYELLALRRAYDGRNRAEVRAKVLAEEPPPLDGLVRNIPAELVAICRKAMHKQPARRYVTAGAFADDLRRWLREEPTTARPAQLPRRLYLWARRNKAMASALGSAFLALALLAGGGVFSARAKA
jgi:eukaryotic-like serine/threonine-protein kinase